MRSIIKIIPFVILTGCTTSQGNKLLKTKEVALADPIVKIDSILFKNQSSIEIAKPYPQSIIRYTLNDEEVTTNSPACPNPLLITKNSNLNIRAFHPDFRPSVSSQYALRKLDSNIELDILANSTQASPPYEAEGVSVLTNGNKGTSDFRANQEWLGFQNEVITLHIQFGSDTYCEQIVLSTLRDQASWIFSPMKIELIHKEKVIYTEDFIAAAENAPNTFHFFDLPVKEKVKEITLKIYMNKIPDWHLGKGTTPWFFMDEIIVQ